MVEHLKFPLFIVWYITNQCNLRCRHCFQNAHTTHMELSIAERAIDVFKQNYVHSIALSGGEPLLHPNFIVIADKIVKNNINLNVATNGLLLHSPNYQAYNWEKINALQISLEGASAETNDFVRGHGTFDKIIKAIHWFTTNYSGRVQTIVSCTLNRRNIDEAWDIKELVASLSVDCLRFAIFSPTGMGAQNAHALMPTNEQMSDFYKRLPNLVADEKISIQVYDPLEESENCGAGLYQCTVDPDFRLSPCDLMPIKTQPISAPEKFKEVWNGATEFTSWRERQKYCGEGCMLLYEQRQGGLLK